MSGVSSPAGTAEVRRLEEAVTAQATSVTSLNAMLKAKRSRNGKDNGKLLIPIRKLEVPKELATASSSSSSGGNGNGSSDVSKGGRAQQAGALRKLQDRGFAISAEAAGAVAASIPAGSVSGACTMPCRWWRWYRMLRFMLV